MTKKTLYICGDSFCSSDPDYGDNWVDLLEKSQPNLNVTNLSRFGASNYLVYLQVKQAIENNCDYLIYFATSSIRQEFVINRDNANRDHINRYWDQTNPDKNKSMASVSWLNPHKNASDFYSAKKISTIDSFFKEFIDLSVLVEKNYIFIDYTLQLIANTMREKTWAWSIGGFEHTSFDTPNQWDFSKYANNHCPINLWDNFDRNLKRPYYHITDKKLLQKVCNQYINMLELNNV